MILSQQKVEYRSCGSFKYFCIMNEKDVVCMKSKFSPTILYELCVVQVKICSTSEDVQYESGTSSVRMMTYSMSEAHLQYK